MKKFLHRSQYVCGLLAHINSNRWLKKLLREMKVDFGFCTKPLNKHLKTLVRHNNIKYYIHKTTQLNSKYSWECNCIFNIGEILKVDIVMAVTTHTIKNGDQTWSYVELVLELVWNLSRTRQLGQVTKRENIGWNIIWYNRSKKHTK